MRRWYLVPLLVVSIAATALALPAPEAQRGAQQNQGQQGGAQPAPRALTPAQRCEAACIVQFRQCRGGGSDCQATHLRCMQQCSLF